ncbi:MAG: hypothetical protein ACK4WB_08810 [Desulfatiglandales bacterium]
MVSAEEAVQTIQSGQRVFMSGNVSVPQELLQALVRYAPNLRDVELVHALTVGPAEYVSPQMEGHLRINTVFISANTRKAVHYGSPCSQEPLICG